MKRGILYGVGIGPGDPELLTLKAARLLREADTVAIPDAGSGARTALEIVKDHIAGKPVLECPTPMVRDRAALDAAHDAIADSLCRLLDEGKRVVYITLGDPTVYSTYLYVHRRVLARGYEAALVPGVPSFCAAAARLNTSLCERNERLLIVPGSYAPVDDCLAADANLVFMKSGKELPALRDKLAEQGLLDRASLVVNCGMPGEQAYERFDRVPPDAGYFALLLVKKHP